MDYFFFFFASKRRHTRLQGDWSSDVCSSDLLVKRNPGETRGGGPGPVPAEGGPGALVRGTVPAVCATPNQISIGGRDLHDLQKRRPDAKSPPPSLRA